MKPQYPKRPLLLIISILSGNILLAQPALEMAPGGGPTTNGYTIASQTVTFQNNTNNPSGNTFVSFTPTTSVTYSLSNQQYSLLRSQASNNATVSFGGTNNNSGSSEVGVPIYNNMNFISAAPNNAFSSIPSTPHNGIFTTGNSAVELFTSAMGLYNSNKPTNGS